VNPKIQCFPEGDIPDPFKREGKGKDKGGRDMERQRVRKVAGKE